MKAAEIKPRMLMGPGPSDVHPRVLEALARPTIGHLDGPFIEMLNDTRDMLRAVFQTANELTLAISGTGSAGMETCLVNPIEPGDKMLVCVADVFGMRMKDVAERAGAHVTAIEVPWGQVFSADQVQSAIDESGPFKEVGSEIGGGLGAFKGKAWRIGLMGESATDRHVQAVVSAIEQVL